jgi:hypothetical protein
MRVRRRRLVVAGNMLVHMLLGLMLMRLRIVVGHVDPHVLVWFARMLSGSMQRATAPLSHKHMLGCADRGGMTSYCGFVEISNRKYANSSSGKIRSKSNGMDLVRWVDWGEFKFSACDGAAVA